MKRNLGALFWGISLLLLGLFLLIFNAGLMPEIKANIWALILGGAALLFLVGYLVSGVKNWPLLFPAMACGAVSAAIIMSENEVDGSLIGATVLFSLSVPFWLAFLTAREANWWALIPGWSLFAVGLVVLLSGSLPGEAMASLILYAIGLPFLVVFLANRSNRWALIPAYILVAIGTILLVAGEGAGELIPSLVMFAIALPFLAVFLLNRANWWALIPAGIMTIIGLGLLLAAGAGEIFAGALIMFGFALPFYVAYFLNREQWWAIIPAGVLTSVGLAVLVGGALEDTRMEDRLIGGIIFAGIALTFGALWALRGRYETDWAKFPATILAGAAILVLAFGLRIELVWAIGLIALGGWLIYRGTRPRPKLPKPPDET